MRMPLWVKNEQGNYEAFPYELLDHFEDGKVGLKAPLPSHNKPQYRLLIKYRKHFDLVTEPTPRFILKEQGMTNSTDLRELTQELYTLKEQYDAAINAAKLADEHAKNTLIKLNDIHERFDSALHELKNAAPTFSKWWNDNQGYPEAQNPITFKATQPGANVPLKPVPVP